MIASVASTRIGLAVSDLHCAVPMPTALKDRVRTGKHRQRITLSRIDAFGSRMGRFANTRLARISDGRRSLIRTLGLVSGGKRLSHHEVVLELTWRGFFPVHGLEQANRKARRPKCRS
jgi:hypothetical protein